MTDIREREPTYRQYYAPFPYRVTNLGILRVPKFDYPVLIDDYGYRRAERVTKRSAVRGTDEARPVYMADSFVVVPAHCFHIIPKQHNRICSPKTSIPKNTTDGTFNGKESNIAGFESVRFGG